MKALLGIRGRFVALAATLIIALLVTPAVAASGDGGTRCVTVDDETIVCID